MRRSKLPSVREERSLFRGVAEQWHKFSQQMETHARCQGCGPAPSRVSGGGPIIRVPHIGNERGAVGAGNARKGWNLFSARGLRHKGGDNRMFRTSPEAPVLRYEVARILAIRRGKPKFDRFRDRVACYSRSEALPVSFSTLMPSGGLVLSLPNARAEGGTYDRFGAEHVVAVNARALAKREGVLGRVGR